MSSICAYLDHENHHDLEIHLDHQKREYVEWPMRSSQFETKLLFLCLSTKETTIIIWNETYENDPTIVPIDRSLCCFLIFICNCGFTFSLSSCLVFINPNFRTTRPFICLKTSYCNKVNILNRLLLLAQQTKICHKYYQFFWILFFFSKVFWRFPN